MSSLTSPIANRLLFAFEGSTAPADLPPDPAGFTLFRDHNVHDRDQLLALTSALRALGPPDLPPLICIDQEGGQFLGLGDIGTPFPGNMALGAAGDADLTEEVALAMGRELRALGISVNYAPVADLTTDPSNPGLGIRSFGDDPQRVGELASATVRGLRRAGVAATAKHFPGKGGAAVDSHYGLPVIDHTLPRLRDVELAPFREAFAAGAELAMTGHFALPEATGRHDLPATLSSVVLVDILRHDLGFDGVVVSDAFNMAALTQGPAQVIDAIAALNNGVDLLLLTFETEMRTTLHDALRLAADRGVIATEPHATAVQRIHQLRRQLAGHQPPDLDVVGRAEHQELARQAAAQAITMVRNNASILPLRLTGDDKILAVMPQPSNLTPADTSAHVAPQLATALRAWHPSVDEIVTSSHPTDDEIAAVVTAASSYSIIVAGTISASMSPPQAALIKALEATTPPVVTLALRTPWDLTSYPSAATHLCTYGLLRPSLDAASAAIFGKAPTPGRLPSAIAGLHPRGHGLEMELA